MYNKTMIKLSELKIGDNATLIAVNDIRTIELGFINSIISIISSSKTAVVFRINHGGVFAIGKDNADKYICEKD